MTTSTALGSWTNQYMGSALDLSGYTLNFSDDFNTADIGGANAAPSAATWFASAHAGFGAATFAQPTSAVNPFSVANGALTINMQQVNGAWQSGLIQTVNTANQGFTQQYGYFEMRAALPAGAGSWPAFWLLSADPTKPRVEIDVMEAYGKDVKGLHTAVHYTPAAGDTSLTQKFDTSDYTGLNTSMFDGQYHTYGVKVDPNWITFYFDRVEVDRISAAQYVGTPLYMVVDLGMNGAEASQASGQYAMNVDYVRAYADPTYTGIIVNGVSTPSLLTGSNWGDTITAGGAGDTLAGGAGNDIYYVNNAHDVVIEKPGEGVDTVISSVSFNAAGQDIENVTLTGSAALNVTGNALNNSLTGNSGNNVLDGGAGADTMAGGAGDDTYYVDDPGDKVIEANNAGTDTVFASVSFNAGGQYIENVTLTGAAAINATGNGLNNILTGNAAANVIDGAAGNDTIDGGQGNDTLTGGAGKDVFIFDSALNASTNVDVITDFNVSDDMIQLDRRVFAGLSVGPLAALPFERGVAAMQAEDRIIYDPTTGALYYDADGTGPIAPVKFAQLASGLSLSNRNFVVVDSGGGVTDASAPLSQQSTTSVVVAPPPSTGLVITGTATSSTLVGTTFGDTLTAGGSGDTLMGGAGDDTYYVNNVADKVIEANNAGIDTVYTSVNFNAGGQYIENVTLTGSNALYAVGNGLNNVLIGNSGANTIDGAAGNDTLDGGAGNDYLTGGAGNDTFVFDTPLDAANNVDVIVDFNPVDDTIQLDHRIFTGLSVGPLAALPFEKAAAAVQVEDRIIYNPTTGGLFYDPDGTGPMAPVKFAQLTPGLALTNRDFIVV